MSSQLAAQLRILAGSGAGTTSRRPAGSQPLASAASLASIRHATPGSTASKYKPSFLFSADVAAATDSATIHSMGVSGMDQLVKLEPRLRPFQTALCQAQSFDRDAHTQQQIQTIQQQLNTCIRMLAPYFLLKPTHKVLEFLIRRYNVHIYNISALLAAFLPYHESALFARLLQVLHVHLQVNPALNAHEPNSNKLFGWMEAAAKEGVASLTRHTLAQRCLQDPAFLQWIIGLVAVKGPNAAHVSTTTATFYTSLMLELLATLRASNNANHSEQKEAIAQAIALHALDVLNAHVNALQGAGESAAPANKPPQRELVFSALLLLSQCALVHRLNAPSLEAAVFLLLRSFPPVREDQSLSHPICMSLLSLAQSQDVASLPPKGVESLLKAQGTESTAPFIAALANLSQQYEISSLITLLLVPLSHAHTGDDKKAAHTLLIELVTSLPLLEKHVHVLVSTLLQVYVNQHAAQGTKEWSVKEIANLRKIVLALQEKYPSFLESAVQACMYQANRDIQEDGQSSSLPADGEKMSRKKHRRTLSTISPLLGLITFLFEGSAHEVMINLKGSETGGPSAASVLSCLSSPLPHIRAQALEAVDELPIKKIGSDTSLSAHLHSALLARLADTDSSVVRTVLKLKSLPQLVPFGELAEALEKLVSKLAFQLDAASLNRNSTAKQLEAAMKAAARMVTFLFADGENRPSQEEQSRLLYSLLHGLWPFLFELSLVRPAQGITPRLALATRQLLVLLSAQSHQAESHHHYAELEGDACGFSLCALFANISASDVSEDSLLEDVDAIRAYNQSLLSTISTNLESVASSSSHATFSVKQILEAEMSLGVVRLARSVEVASKATNKVLSSARVSTRAPTTGFVLVQILNETLVKASEQPVKKVEANATFSRLVRAQQKVLEQIWASFTNEQKKEASKQLAGNEASSSSSLVAPSAFVSSANGAAMGPTSFPAFVRSSLALLVQVTHHFSASRSSSADSIVSDCTAVMRALYSFFVSESESMLHFGAHIGLLCKLHLNQANLQDTVRFLMPMLQGSGKVDAQGIQVSVRSFHLLHALLQKQAEAGAKPSKNKEEAALLSELATIFLLSFASPSRALRHAAIMAIPALSDALATVSASERKATPASLLSQLMSAAQSEKEELLSAGSSSSQEDSSLLLESASDASLQYMQDFLHKLLVVGSTEVLKAEAQRVELQRYLTSLALKFAEAEGADAEASLNSAWRLLLLLRRLPHARVADLTLPFLSTLLSSAPRSSARADVSIELVHHLDVDTLQTDKERTIGCILQALALPLSLNNKEEDGMEDEEEEDEAAAGVARRAATALQQAALTRITTELFELLSTEQQEQLFATLLRIAPGQPNVSALVAQLPFDSSVFIQRLSLTPAGGKKKKDKATAAAAASTTTDLPTVQLVLEMLQLKNPHQALRTPFALVAPLFQLLQQLNLQSHTKEQNEEENVAQHALKQQAFEYAKQLTMSVLTHFLDSTPATDAADASASSKKSKKQVTATAAAFNLKDINVEAVVACLGSMDGKTAAAASTPASTSPLDDSHAQLRTLDVSLENTRTHALTLLSLIGRLHPELIVGVLIPIFKALLLAEEGEAQTANALSTAMEAEEENAHKEGEEAAVEPAEPYALRLLNQLISTVLSSVVRAQLQWNVWQLLSVFVDSLTANAGSKPKSLSKKKGATDASSGLATRRRLNLFHNLLSSLQLPVEEGEEAAAQPNYLHMVLALILAKVASDKSGSKSATASSLMVFAHALCEQFGEEPVYQVRAFNQLLQLLAEEMERGHGEIMASQKKNIGVPLRLGAAKKGKKGAEATASPLSTLLTTANQANAWQVCVLSFLSHHLSRLSFAQQIYLHAKRKQQEAEAEAEGEETPLAEDDEIQTSFLHLFEHLFARLRSSLLVHKHLSAAATSSDSSDSESDESEVAVSTAGAASTSLRTHFLKLSTHTKNALLHLNGLLSMANFVKILKELFRISATTGEDGKDAPKRDVQLILQALSLLNSKLISYKDREKIHKRGSAAEEEDEEVMSDDPNSIERQRFFKAKKAEQRLLVSLLPSLQQLLEVESTTDAGSKQDVASMKQSTLLNLEMLTSSFGHMRQFQAEFVKLVPTVLRLTLLPSQAEDEDEATHAHSVSTLLTSSTWQHITTSALLCLATLVSSFHAKAHVLLMEFIPVLMPNTLAILKHINKPKSVEEEKSVAGKKRKHDEEEEDDEEEKATGPKLQTLENLVAPLLQLSALSVLQACLVSVSDLLSPYLSDLLKVLLYPGYHNSSAGGNATVSMALLAVGTASAGANAAATTSSSVDHSSVSTIVAQSLNSLIALIPSRTLLPYVFNHYKAAALEGYSSLHRLFTVLGLIIQQLKAESVKQHFKIIFKFFLAAAQQLRKRSTASGAPAADLADAYGVSLSQAEDALIHSFLDLTLKLNETSFKGLFLKLLQWVGPIPNLTDAGVDTTMDTAATGGPSSTGDFLNRSLVLFKLINQLIGKLKGIFVTYFGYVMDHCVVFLNAPTKEDKNKKKSQAMEDSEEESEEEEEGDEPANKKRKNEDGSASASAVSARKAAALSSGIAGGVPSELIDLVLHSLRQCFLYDTQHFMDKYHFQLLTPSMVNQLSYAFQTRRAPQSSGARHVHAPFDDFISHTLSPTVVQMASRMGNYLQWKPLVTHIMTHGRSPAPHVRRASVYLFEQLFVYLGDNFLVVLPELLPWISELLEDGDVGVERNVQKLVKIIEKLSGESLEEALHGGE